MTAGHAEIVYVGHATVVVDLDGVRLLTDPLLRPRLMHLRRVRDIDLEDVRDIDAVLLSHLHFDHLDFPSLEELGRSVRLLVPRGAGALLGRRGFTAVTELAAGDEAEVGTLTVRATPAVHDATRMPLGAKAEPVGFLITGSCTVYFAGDTELFAGMSELAPVDVALLPISGWGPRLGYGHMGPEAAVEAARLLRASVVVPIHWGTYFPFHSSRRKRPAFVDAPAEEFASRMREDAPEIVVHVLESGSSVTL
jgi:L-ascorbate metabolism protein UlaG (beta-lactamase superfamily)